MTETPGFLAWLSDVRRLWPASDTVYRSTWYNLFMAGWMPADAIKYVRRELTT